MRFPRELVGWTLTEVAECRDGISRELTGRLWGLFAQCENHSPMGGDGSNGTIEEPELHTGDDTLEANWGKLSATDQQAIAATCDPHYAVKALRRFDYVSKDLWITNMKFLYGENYWREMMGRIHAR